MLELQGITCNPWFRCDESFVGGLIISQHNHSHNHHSLSQLPWLMARRNGRQEIIKIHACRGSVAACSPF